MSDVSIEDQATLALMFDENIRDIVRKHLKQALEDPSFMGSLHSFCISDAAMRHMSAGNINFQQAVKQVMIMQMNKY